MPMSNAEAREVARRGPGRIAYLIVRVVLMPLLQALFAVRVAVGLGYAVHRFRDRD